MAASILFLLPVLALTAATAHAQPTAYQEHPYASTHAQAVAEFTASVHRYLEVRRLLESPMSRLFMGADLEQTARAREAHRKAIAEARVATPRGDVFTRRVAADFRHELRIAAYLARVAEPKVTQVATLERLPGLPTELEYRFVDRDLVLLDTETYLVVDILEHALPPELELEQELCAPEFPAPVESSPCVAHPELEMCWS
jgi:hypothetical protein